MYDLITPCQQMVNYKTFLSNKKNLEGHTLRFKQSLSHFTMPAAMGATPFTSWNMELKEIWKLPYQTHRYFFEHLTPCRHLKVLLIKRFLKFVKSITDGQKSSCKLLLRTVSGTVQMGRKWGILNWWIASKLFVVISAPEG